MQCAPRQRQSLIRSKLADVRVVRDVQAARDGCRDRVFQVLIEVSTFLSCWTDLPGSGTVKNSGSVDFGPISS